MYKSATVKITRSAVIGALYLALTFATLSVSSGAIQFRASEALTLLPLIFPESIVGLFVGCLLSNLIAGCATYDIIFGSVITLTAAALTFVTGKFIKAAWLKYFVGGLFPVLLNAFFLPLIWIWAYGGIEYAYMMQVLFLIISQSVSIYAIGVPLCIATNRILNRQKKNKEDEGVKISETENTTDTK